MSGHTPGPWSVFNMVNDKGERMTPEEIGEYVTNSVRMGALDRFLFVSAKHEDGRDVDVCHVGNGPRGPINAHLIAAAPDMLEALKAVLPHLPIGFADTGKRTQVPGSADDPNAIAKAAREAAWNAIAKAEGRL